MCVFITGWVFMGMGTGVCVFVGLDVMVTKCNPSVVCEVVNGIELFFWV